MSRDEIILTGLLAVYGTAGIVLICVAIGHVVRLIAGLREAGKGIDEDRGSEDS